MLEINQIHHGDCLELMHQIPDGSVDMVLADLPYGTTACAWDSIIPLEPLWEHYKRIIKPRGAIVLTASQPFTTMLINAGGLDWFKYNWVWDKVQISNPQLAKIQPLKNVEDVLVFGNGKIIYNPQGLSRDIRKALAKRGKWSSTKKAKRRLNHIKIADEYSQEFTNYPKSLITIPTNRTNVLHPTQKPVALFAYLINTYSNPGDLILDNAAGSGTTAIAAIQTGRNWLCIEKDADIYQTAANRISKALGQGFTPAVKAGQPNNGLHLTPKQRGLFETE